MSNVIYGWGGFRHKVTGKPAPTGRSAYDSKGAAVLSFNRWLKVNSKYGEFSHLSGMKFKDQNEFEIVELVAR